MKKILVAASYFYPKIGGLENYAYLLAKGLHESGEYEVCIVTSNYDSKGYKKELIDGMTVHRLPIWFKVSNTPINPFWYWSVRKIIAKERPDLVHVHSPVPYLPDVVAAAAKDIPVVLTYHSGSMLKNKFPVDLLIGVYENVFLKKLFKRSAAVVTISQEFARKRFPEFTSKMHFIPTGVDLKRFEPSPLPTNEETVTFVGRVETTSMWKGIDQLLLAVAKVLTKRPKAKLEIVGGGDAIPHFKQFAEELGISNSVKFLGPQLGEDLVQAYKRSNMIVLPSISDSEAFSITLVEAMASGRPIIGTRIGGTPQVIEDGSNGLLVPASDPTSLAQAILSILEDPELAHKLADEGARRSKGFSWDIRVREYANLFETVHQK